MVGAGPAFLGCVVAFLGYSFVTDTLDVVLLGCVVILGIVTWPMILIGIYRDVRALDQPHDIAQHGLFWDVFALVVPWVAGLVYLWQRTNQSERARSGSSTGRL